MPRTDFGMFDSDCLNESLEQSVSMSPEKLADDPASGKSKSSLVLSIYNMNATRCNRKISQDYRSFE